MKTSNNSKQIEKYSLQTYRFFIFDPSEEEPCQYCEDGVSVGSGSSIPNELCSPALPGASQCLGCVSTPQTLHSLWVLHLLPVRHERKTSRQANCPGVSVFFSVRVINSEPAEKQLRVLKESSESLLSIFQVFRWYRRLPPPQSFTLSLSPFLFLVFVHLSIMDRDPLLYNCQGD